MTTALVVYASRHGGTAGIARRIGEILQTEGLDASVADAAGNPAVDGFDAYVIGSGVYMGSWLKDGTDFVGRNASHLALRPVWLFSSGPLRGSTAETDGGALEDALGPAEGPGSGGRKKVEELAAGIHARAHQIFYGAFDPNDPPKAMSERLVRMVPASKGLLPPGDYREWDVIEAWARAIGRELLARVPAEVG
jgi:menaquinone-dependent protoporphyrinogen oxidase